MVNAIGDRDGLERIEGYTLPGWPRVYDAPRGSAFVKGRGGRLTTRMRP
ncbi:MAG: hypothetical protein M3169_11030 [Candidatus Eremiobacteraeota bacterium]|nr:hypothetical protein [Candidatus Eremiobacteraeota bacterium]